MSNTYDEAYNAIVANEVVDLTNQVCSCYGAEAFVDAWIADPAKVLANIYSCAVASIDGRDDHAIAAVVRASLAGQIRKAAEHTAQHHRTDDIAHLKEELEMTPAQQRRMAA